MMKENASGEAPSRFRVPLGLVGALAMIAAVESAIGSNAMSFRNPWGWDWFQANRAAEKEAPRCEVLFFGDSMVKFGVAPRVVERESGRKAYNLAIAAGPVPASYFLFRRAIEGGARPKAVVIDAIPHLLASGLSPSAVLWPDLLSSRDCLELAYEAKDADFFASTSVARLFPSVRDRIGIRNALMAAFRGEPPPLRNGVGTYLRNWRENRGAQVMKRDPNAPPIPADPWAPALFPDSWRPDPINTHFLREFFRLADLHGIQVYWLLPPFGPEVQARRDSGGRDAEYEAFVRKVRQKHPNVIVLDARRRGYGDDVHIDPIHLDLRGASALSRDLADLLARPPDRLTSWTQMPPFREPSPGGPLEDVEQSGIAVMLRHRR